jgi:uncharacterized protein
MNIKLILLIAGAFLLMPVVLGFQVERGTYIFGVIIYPNGSVVGSPSVLNLTLTNGTGQIFLASVPLVQTSTQAQAVVSTQTACFLLNINCNKYNFYYSISSQSSEVGGPSAGAAFTILAMAALLNVSIKPNVAMTGIALPDGGIGLVGDVSEKSEAAANIGIKYFLYPVGDNVTASAINYDSLHGETLIPVSNIFQAFAYFTGYNITQNYSFSIPSWYNTFQNYSFIQIYNYQESILKNLSNYSGSNVNVYMLMAEAKPLLNKEYKLYLQGLGYLASSIAVNSSIPALVKAQFLAGNFSLPQAISDEAAAINDTLLYVEHKAYNASTEVFVTTAIERVYEAQNYLNLAKEALSIGDYSTALDFYAYAVTKQVTARFWDAFLPYSAVPFNQSSLYGLANFYLYAAQSYETYSSAISYPSDLAAYYLNLSQYEFEQGNYIKSLYDALNSIAESQLAIESINSLSPQSNSTLLNISLDSAKLAIHYAEEAGADPVLGITNFVLANSSVYGYKYRLQFAAFSRVFAQYEEALANNYKLPQLVKTSLPSLTNVHYYEYLSLFFALGFGLGAIVEAIISTMIKKHHKKHKA